MSELHIVAGHKVDLDSPEGTPEQVHVFDERSIKAVNAALAAKRPLLVRGEPGIGKSQLAQAVAKALDRAFIPFVVDSHTESRDLLWTFDAVSRLAEAQLAAALQETPDQVRERLALENFVRPGPLWWAFDWHSASQLAPEGFTAQTTTPIAETREQRGVVVLIDEIDKAESDVPNGLLEALGIGAFRPSGGLPRVSVQSPAPLVIITSNEERLLPDAFVRRCLVLNLKLPPPGPQLIDQLMTHGQAHFKDADDEVLKKAAEQLSDDRQAVINAQQTPLPGQAEYLDLVRAVLQLGKNIEEQKNMLKEIGEFVLKHPEIE